MNVFTIEIDPREIKLLQQNARYMKHEEFNRLVENVRRDGKLTSTPFLCKENDGFLCLSGNHRTRAAIEVGLPKITCLATDTLLTEEQKIAIQLSHNAIAGQDDPATLKQLYEKILDTDLKKYSGLDDKTLELLDKFNPFSISEASLNFQVLSIVFLPSELETAKSVINTAMEQCKSSNEIWLAKMSEYDSWLDSQEIAASSHNVKNVATAINIILKVFEKNLTDLSEIWEDEENGKRRVPIETVIGNNKIPVQTAKILKKALEKVQSKGEISDLISGLEKLCEDYLTK
ncbi:MAG: ParB/RepB/Spo0J family partition protein [Firmicutes bacterium]|nr:ParB/RepB/Spo0J family partition protein [Bacillota bacterium]